MSQPTPPSSSSAKTVQAPRPVTPESPQTHNSSPAKTTRSQPQTLDLRLKTQRTAHFTIGGIARSALRIATLLPFIMILPALVTLNGGAFSAGVADVLGTSSELLLIMCLAVTPLITMTGWRWIAPMRQWYGIVFGISAITDASIAAVTTTDFAGGPVGRLSGHTFLLVGLTMVTILVPLTLTANRRSQKLLGKYWKMLQRATYVVWGLLVVHLALLSGLLPGEGQTGDGFAVFHQRLYQIVAVSIPLLTLRIPAVRKWAIGMRKEGRAIEMWLVLLPLIIIGIIAFLFIEHEFFFKGIALLEQTPVND